jgi:hypothetical protein
LYSENKDDPALDDLPEPAAAPKAPVEVEVPPKIEDEAPVEVDVDVEVDPPKTTEKVRILAKCFPHHLLTDPTPPPPFLWLPRGLPLEGGEERGGGKVKAKASHLSPLVKENQCGYSGRLWLKFRRPSIAKK